MATNVRDRIAREVRAELARQNKSQRWVGEQLGIDQGSASLRLAGKRAFRAEELAALALALGVPVSQFMPAEGAPADASAGAA